MWVTFICSNCYIRFIKMNFECLVKKTLFLFSPTLQTGFNIPVILDQYTIFFFKWPSKIHFVRVAQNIKEYTLKIDSKKKYDEYVAKRAIRTQKTHLYEKHLRNSIPDSFHTRSTEFNAQRTLVQIFHILSSKFKWWHLLYRLIFFMVILMF